MRVTMLLRSADRRSKTVIRNVIAGLLLAAASNAYAQGLPAQVQADLLIQKITASMEAGKAQDALEALAEYRNLGVNMPPALLFLEARLAAISKDYLRSKKALVEYLALTDVRNDRNYASSLTLHLEVEKQLNIERNSVCKAVALRNSIPSTACQIEGSFRDSSMSPEMVVIPGGSFSMGSISRFIYVYSRPVTINGVYSHDTPELDNSNEMMAHIVSIKSLAVSKNEITISEWRDCVANGGCKDTLLSRPLTNEKLPAVNVSWNDAQDYISWISKTTGNRYRLLSEAEWEYVARGETSSPYSFGNEINQTQANYKTDGPVAVGSFPPNRFGINDTHGNVWEWVQDCKNDSYIGSPLDGSAWLTGDCTKRMIRGGSFINHDRLLRVTARTNLGIDQREDEVGFRVARELDQ